jgi:hypothetical protein
VSRGGGGVLTRIQYAKESRWHSTSPECRRRSFLAVSSPSHVVSDEGKTIELTRPERWHLPGFLGIQFARARYPGRNVLISSRLVPLAMLLEFKIGSHF